MEGTRYPLIAGALAIAITATMDYLGYAQFSALPLFPLILLFWVIQRPTMKEWGLSLGTGQGYALAVFYPLFVIGGLALVTLAAGAASTGETDWPATLEEMALVASASIIGAFITEEGFFRGTLWAGMKKSGAGLGKTLLWTSLIFTAWHISWAVLPGQGQLPALQVPVYLANVALLGAAWGLIRAISGSVVAASVSHGVWNGFVYLMFGFGADGGALNVTDVIIYGPERGVLGIVLNSAFVFWLWRRARKAGIG